MTTTLLQKNISRVFPNKSLAVLVEVLFLLGVGVAAITLHAKLRIPMQLPGKHGLLYIALLMTAKSMSRFPYAATLSSMGSALILLTGVLGFNQALIAVIYLLLGIVMDATLYALSKFSSNRWFLSLAGGITWMLIPLLRVGFGIMIGFETKAYAFGAWYPFLTHFIFGYAGMLAALALIKAFPEK